MQRKIVVLMADMHSGHKLGLCNPDTIIVDTSQNPPKQMNIELIEWQEYLWYDIYEKGMEKVVEIAGEDEIIVQHLGDIIQGSKHPYQLVTPSFHNQCAVAYWNIKPWMVLQNVKKVRIHTGTPAHDGDYLGAPVIVAEKMRDKHVNVDVKVVHHSLQNIDGLLLDLAHHGSSTGIRNWTKGNVMRYELTSMVLDALQAGEQPADIYARAHFHTPHEEVITRSVNGKSKLFRYMLLPSIVGMGHYARKVTKSTPKITNGFTALEIVDGKLVDVHWLTETKDLRTLETF